MIKKLFKVAGLILLLLLLFALSAPLLFRGKIESLVKTQINKKLRAKVDFSAVDISLFRNFPRLAVALDSLSVVGTGEFSEDTLVAAKRINIALNLMSVISGSQVQIHSISVERPRIHAIVHKDGHNNWTITIPDTSAQNPGVPAEGKPFKMDLRQYTITDAYISYRDDSSNMRTEIAGLNHSGSGDFSSDLFTLHTKTSTETLNFTYGAIPYLVNTKTSVAMDLEVDSKSHKYSFKVDGLSLNDLKLNTVGFVQLVNDSAYDMDVQFNSSALDFKSILSLVPAIYKKDFGTLKTSGEATLKGFLKGRYDSRHVPAYQVDLEVKNGFFKYPDLPKPVKNINVSLQADNPDGVTDHTVVNIFQAHLEMEETPFDFRLLVKNPISDPYIDAAARGTLDLAKLVQFVKLDTGTRLSGLLNADVNIKGNLSAIEKQQYDQFAAAGAIGLANFSYASVAYPSGINLEKLLLGFNPKNVILNEMKGDYLKTHFSANGTINNLLAYLLKNKPLEGSLALKADQVNLNEWMGTLSAKDSAAVGTLPATTGAGGTAATSTAPFAVPANISFILTATVDKLHYDKLDLENLSGGLQIADETVKMNNIKASGLDGTMIINGAYSTRISKKTPAIAFSYAVQRVDVQKTYYAFNTVQKLMPAGKFMNGKFSSQLSMYGILGPDMKPDLNSLNGEGTALLLDGSLKNFGPLEKLAETAKLDQLKEIPVKDINLSFSFHNGKVLVSPFHVKVKDIDMEIGGTHGFDQSLDYTINLKLPRNMLGGDVNSLVNGVVSQLGGKGIPVKVNDKISVNAKMGGTITNPLLKMDLQSALTNAAGGIRSQALDLVKARVDSAKQQLHDTVKVIRQQVIKDAGDELKKQLLGKKDSAGTQPAGLDDTRKKAEEAGKGLLNSLFKKNKSR